MMHALDGTNHKKILPQLPALDKETEILNKNMDFFKRGATHLLAERLKKSEGMNPDVGNKIKYKWDQFMNMLNSVVPPTDDSADPVAVYGLDRATQQEYITKLQTQFRNASMTCYELGYIKQCPEWKTYMAFPEYWYKVYEQRLLSDERVKKWLAHTIDSGDSNPDAINGKDQVKIWAHKLSLLKHAQEAQGKKSDETDVDKISDILLTKLHEEPAYKQLLYDEFTKGSSTVSHHGDSIYKLELTIFLVVRCYGQNDIEQRL